MVNLNEKIQNLLKNTSSEEVKSICESFLNEAADKEVYQSDKIALKLFEDLKTYANVDSQIGTLLLEKEDYAKNIMDIEAKISKNAAQNFAANWDLTRRDKKISNVGNHMDNTIKQENIKKAADSNSILEKLSIVDDAGAKKIVADMKMNDYSIKESISTLKKSQISNHPNLKYVIAKFESALMENTPEFLLANDFIFSMTPFKWDVDVKAAINRVQESINSKAVEIEVQTAIHNIKSTDSKRFFTELVEKLNDWVLSENKNVPSLLKDMKGYMFNPYIKNLSNKLMVMENAKGTQFNIPVKDSNCEVHKIFSPVHLTVAGQVFKAGDNFYHSTDNGIKKLSEAQVNALPKNFLELCDSFFNESVKVTDDSVSVYFGKSKVQLMTDGKIFVNENQVEPSSLGTQLVFLTQQTVFRDTSNMANVVMNIYENMDNICEIDYGKHISSSVFEGVGVYLFKKDGTIYINKMNKSMNENKFLKANAIQTVNFVKEFLSFNMSESLGDFLEGDHKKKVEMTSELNKILGDITLVECELEKIEKAILADPSYAEVKEITDAKTLLENELNNLRSIWQEKNNELKNFEIVEEDKSEPEEEEEEELEAKEDSKEEPAEYKEGEEADEDPIVVEEPQVVVEDPVEPQVQSEVVAHGLAGAEGTQNADIQGNDHIEAHVDQAADANGGVVNAGFAGAEVPHVDDTPEPQICVDPTPIPVLTPGTATEVIQGSAAPVAVPVSAGQEAAVDVAVVDVAPEETPSEPVDGYQEGNSEEDVQEDEGEKEKSEEVTESIGADSKVKDKVTGKPGTVTSVGDEHFIVLLDDGSSVERKLSELEDVEEEMEQNITKNEEPINVEEVTEGEQVDEPKKEESNGFVLAALTIDLGPFKAGEQVEIDAANYTAVGDDDPVKLKDEKEGVGEIPKKYLNVIEDENGVESVDGVDAKVEDVLMRIKELETFLVGKNIKGSKAIEGAKEKIKKFAASLEDAEEEKQKGDESDANSGEETK